MKPSHQHTLSVCPPHQPLVQYSYLTLIVSLHPTNPPPPQDNMLMAAGSQATDQPKHTLVPAQYTYSQDVASMQMHQAMNLVQPQIPTVTSSDPVHVIVYQNEQQQVSRESAAGP